jgi:poly(hydroxyalkanoate) depolymerase family esterase
MNINSISSTIDRAFAAAGLTTSPTAIKVSETIRKALGAAGIAQVAPAEPARSPSILRRFVNPHDHGRTRVPLARIQTGMDARNLGSDVEEDVGEFTPRSYSNGRAARTYKLYVPSSYDGQPMPLIVMLHGCKQNPDDFALGTGMNELAESHGFLVAYPAQTTRANGANCWNWFETTEQSRSGEEPSLIAGIAHEIRRTHRVDEARVFVAGLSAGGAMAVILGATYPDVFAAVGVHSGLPMGAARDVPSAFAAMRGSQAGALNALRPGRDTAPSGGVPTIIFHGDSDITVHASNGAEVAEQARSGYSSSGEFLREEALPRKSAGGREFTTTRYLDGSGHAVVEHWVVHGASHSWSGGKSDGSYTDPKGPNASAEMVRFFLEQ